MDPCNSIQKPKFQLPSQGFYMVLSVVPRECVETDHNQFLPSLSNAISYSHLFNVTLTSGIDKGPLNNLHVVQEGYVHL